jgi:PAS domain S-box-containing protein
VDALVVETPLGERVFTLESAERPYRTFVEEMPQGVATVSAHGVVLYCNRSLSRMMGVPYGQAIGSILQEAVQPQDRRAVEALLAEPGRHPLGAEVTLLPRGQAPLPVHFTVHAVPDDHDHDHDRVVGLVVTDLTDRRRHETIVAQRTRELEESNRRMVAFSYSISHDLKAPLRAIRGYIDAMVEDCGERLHAEGLEYADRIARAADRMDSLIADLLSYSRLGQVDLAHVPVTLVDVVESALSELEPLIIESGATIERDVPATLPRVRAHSASLCQAITNLVGNALKFVAPGETPRIRIWAAAREGRVRLAIEDQGIGIAPEHHDRIFGVFERLHTRGPYAGSGVGLAMVKMAVERMGGSVGVESALGSGSRFWIELPALPG